MEQTLQFSKRKVLQGSFLVGGTAIGAGMLALPIASANAGFLPAICLYFVCWIFSMITGLLMLEVSMTMAKDANLVSMSKRYLGRVGKGAAWCLYLFLFYSLDVAYVTGGGNMITSMIMPSAPPIWGMSIFALIFGTIVTLGAHAVNRFNVVFMFGLVLSYFVFIGVGIDKINPEYLTRVDYKSAALALPIIFTSFSYQGVIPSLNSFLGKNRKMARLSIILGSTIPFVVYIIWDMMIKGIVPLEGANGLLYAKEHGIDAITPLKHFLPHAPLTTIGRFFAFFAIATSFLGVTLGLCDFLADGLNVKKKGMNNIFLSILVFMPPVLIGALDPSIFFSALKYAGGIGCVLLLGMLPTLMVWVGRYVKRDLPEKGEVVGGKVLFVILILFMIFEVGLTLS
ncbi:MAG: aromatic amino acid transport family protein [Rhabdochlamydiaceae bacterium]|nr:aromatic amino acid transport family protein [Candidatus Amphrikana amoebophyrae]